MPELVIEIDDGDRVALRPDNRFSHPRLYLTVEESFDIADVSINVDQAKQLIAGLSDFVWRSAKADR